MVARAMNQYQRIAQDPKLPDGLYTVIAPPLLTAGFVVEGGRIRKCAPILKRRIGYWIKRATRVQEGALPREVRW